MTAEVGGREGMKGKAGNVDDGVKPKFRMHRNCGF